MLIGGSKRNAALRIAGVLILLAIFLIIPVVSVAENIQSETEKPTNDKATAEFEKLETIDAPDSSDAVKPLSEPQAEVELIDIGFDDIDIFTAADVFLELPGMEPEGGAVEAATMTGATPYTRRDVLPYMMCETAPRFSLQTTEGSYKGLSDATNKPVLILFWTSLSSDSLDTLAVMRAVSDFYPGMDVMAINPLPRENNNAVWTEAALFEHIEWIKAYFSSIHLYKPALLDMTGEIYRQYGCGSTPTAFFIDRDGIIRIKWAGRLTRDILSELLFMMKALDN